MTIETETGKKSSKHSTKINEERKKVMHRIPSNSACFFSRCLIQHRNVEFNLTRIKRLSPWKVRKYFYSARNTFGMFLLSLFSIDFLLGNKSLSDLFLSSIFRQITTTFPQKWLFLFCWNSSKHHHFGKHARDNPQFWGASMESKFVYD
jgi:hypothetical protein